MSKNLIIVESPAKAKTIEKFLGRKYTVKASMGHIRDLPKSQLGVNVEAGFEPKYITIRGKGEVLKELRDKAKKADKVFLATDPDREGEAISWHLANVLGIPTDQPVRIEFHEITKDAIQKAIKKPRTIDASRVEAQQARRILDRLVGYKLSPLLWRKVRRGLSAGRVQSVAVRLIVDREAEIKAFVPEEYWSLTAKLAPADADVANIAAKYYGTTQGKVELKSEAQTASVVEAAQAQPFVVTAVKKREKKRNPAFPFTTSSLQQEASRKLGFTVRRTMAVAQQLYEGLDLGDEGHSGLVTYIRTDSTRIAGEAEEAVREYIKSSYGPEFLPQEKREAEKKAGEQGAHEA
ncbi:MAG TPA: type I DNA topoisomerase, partial [Symbiobacteriaceae bacterium]|nr:type I DNA topoisomerase [Symbiobacteriaceae bacterium]